MSKNNIIEINGKRYDAATGVLLHHATEKTAHHAAKPAMGRDVVRHPAKHTQRHAPAPSHTLMRHAVHKPAPSHKHQLKAQSSTDLLITSPMADIVAKKSSARLLDHRRVKHAERVPKSRLVSHFSTVTMSAQPLAQHQPAQPKPVHHAAHRPAPHPKKPETTAQLLERVLERAESHKQPPVKLPRRGKVKRRASIGGTVVLAVALLVVIAIQNLSSAQLQSASAQAGFTASLPAYHPPGFSRDKLQSSAGVVKISFRSNSDNRGYSIIQRASPWSSPDLRDSFVAAADKNFQTVAAGGRTVFIYGTHNATWVSGGVWYLIQTGGALSDQQLVQLASSV